MVCWLQKKCQPVNWEWNFLLVTELKFENVNPDWRTRFLGNILGVTLGQIHGDNYSFDFSGEAFLTVL